MRARFNVGCRFLLCLTNAAHVAVAKTSGNKQETWSKTLWVKAGLKIKLPYKQKRLVWPFCVHTAAFFEWCFKQACRGSRVLKGSVYLYAYTQEKTALQTRRVKTGKKGQSPYGKTIHSHINTLIRIPGSPPLLDWFRVAERFRGTVCLYVLKSGKYYQG